MPPSHNPYAALEQPGLWLRGNLHAHTNRSDGERPPQEVIDDYATRGYDFLMISDHDIFTGAAEHAMWNARNLILVPGNEISARGPHLLHVNADRRLDPAADRQQVIDAARASQGFIICNHPNWTEDFNHCPFELLDRLQGYCGIEIYNGVIGRLAGSSYATDKWDRLLTRGRRAWGFANDDSHARAGEVALGWNMVYARDRSLPAIIDAMVAGRFYASTGVIIRRITLSGARARIETENAHRIIAVADHGRRLAHADATALELTVPDTIRYLRFECWGAGEQFAWTQPFLADGPLT